jgi:hypothetical protein
VARRAGAGGRAVETETHTAPLPLSAGAGGGAGARDDALQLRRPPPHGTPPSCPPPPPIDYTRPVSRTTGVSPSITSRPPMEMLVCVEYHEPAARVSRAAREPGSERRGSQGASGEGATRASRQLGGMSDETLQPAPRGTRLAAPVPGRGPSRRFAGGLVVLSRRHGIERRRVDACVETCRCSSMLDMSSIERHAAAAAARSTSPPRRRLWPRPLAGGRVERRRHT